MLGRTIKFLLILVGLVTVIGAAGYFALKRDDIPYETLAAKYESAASRYIDLPSGVRMHYRDQGERDRPALLMVHGFSSSLHTWEPWVHELGGDFRVVTLDLPGHGLTSAPAGYDASIEAYVGEVAAFTQALGLTRFAIAGNSMGGNVAWEYTLAHPDEVDALILIGSSGWPESDADRNQEPLVFKLLRNPVLGPLLRDLDNTQLVRNGVESSFHDPALVDDAMVDRYAELSRAPGHRAILLQMTLGFSTRNFATPERLAHIAAPTLILHGVSDRIVAPDQAQRFDDAITGSRLVMLDEVGHLPQEEIAAESAEIARAFLAEVHETEAAAAP